MSLNKMNTTGRFSDRVEDYDLYRPSYPSSLLDYLNQQVGLRGSRVADVGAGTGIFSKLLLERGSMVDAVEPNIEMGHALVKNLGNQAGFNFWPGTAESTGLASASVNLITCAQAFHWFDPSKTRTEFDRIIKARGMIALIWNDQKREHGLGQAYEEIKTEFGGDEFKKVSDVTNEIEAFFPNFFGSTKYESKVFDNFQELEERGFIGRFFSSSYAPKPNTTAGDKARKALELVFKKFERNGTIRLEYKAELFLGY